MPKMVDQKKVDLKKRLHFSTFACAICLLLMIFYTTAQAINFKWMRIGNIEARIEDCAHTGQTPSHFYQAKRWNHYTHWRIGAVNWTDENGQVWLHKVGGTGPKTVDAMLDVMPIEDDQGLTIKRYFRFAPPSIIVNGVPQQDPFPLEGDVVDPDYIDASGGKGAEVMVESWMKLAIGITIHQKVFAFSQKNHDDYLIYDWTFKNTTSAYVDGNGKTVNLPGQTLKDVYFQFAAMTYGWDTYYGYQADEWPNNPDADSLRIAYRYPGYPTREIEDVDKFGWPDLATGFIGGSSSWSFGYAGFAIIHADKSASDETDDRAKPRSSATGRYRLAGVASQHDQYDPYICELNYSTMKWGYYDTGIGEKAEFIGDLDSTKRALGHQTYPCDQRKILGYRNTTSWLGSTYLSGIGPYTLEPGEDFRVVYAEVGGALSYEKRWEIGKAWKTGNCQWEGDYYLPPPFVDFPEAAPTDNDKAKDSWVHSQKDSLFQNTWNATWALEHNYDVPLAPPPPGIEVTALPNKIVISWGDESEAAPDFKGYRVYRAAGSPDTTFFKIHEVEGASTHSFDDVTAQRGVSYYYYVAAFDDGTQNNGIHPGESLESGLFYNRMPHQTGVALTRASGESLDEIRVVPNPLHISSGNLFPGQSGKILFVGLPPECTIRIFTLSGDLVRSFEHTDGSGDEPWDDLTTSSNQILVSGIYIAHIETPGGNTKFVKFSVIR